MPEQSLFGDIVHEGACVAEGERCDPLAVAPCCEPGQVCRGMHYGAYLCARRCTAWPCDYGDRRGACFGGLCHVLAGTVPAAECAVGESGCTTEYGVAEGTACVEFPDPARSVCLERCVDGPTGCDEPGVQCVPLVTEEGGFCTSW
jgi:hypothetical protein